MKRSWQLAIGAAIVLWVIAAVVLLSQSAPALTGPAQQQQVDTMTVTVQLDDATVGERLVEVSARDGAGRPVALRSVALSFSMAEMDMGTTRAEAAAVGAGRFQARGQFFAMAGRWIVEATLVREGAPALRTSFAFPIAAPGEAAGPSNPLTADEPTVALGQRLYLTNCATCHGPTGQGDGPAGVALNPRPGNFTQHMLPGKHTDGQVFLWIKNGYPGSAMPAFASRLDDQQIWQLVLFLQTFGRPAASVQGAVTAYPAPQALPTPPTAPAAQFVPTFSEPLPPLVFTRNRNIWRSAGNGTPPQPLTQFNDDHSAQYPAYALDAAQVAFITTSPPPVTATDVLPTAALFVMQADGTAQRVLWKPPLGLLGAPAWAPDGATIDVPISGFRPERANGTSPPDIAIMRVNLVTGAQQMVIDGGLDPTFSRDGTRMAFLRLSADGQQETLEVAAPDGSGARVVLNTVQFQGFYAPRFSPDGKQIVVAAVGGPPTDPQGVPTGQRNPGLLDQLLAWFEPQTAEAHGAPWDLWMVNSDGTGLRRLTTLYDDLPVASFAPDGKTIAVQSASGIYLLNPDGSNFRRIDPQGEHGGLDWRPTP